MSAEATSKAPETLDLRGNAPPRQLQEQAVASFTGQPYLSGLIALSYLMGNCIRVHWLQSAMTYLVTQRESCMQPASSAHSFASSAAATDAEHVMKSRSV